MSIKKQNRIRRAKAGDISGRRWWVKFCGSFPFARVKAWNKEAFKESP